MKAVMLSIQPKWIELIASGKKTVEARKTKPKIDVPFKCYICCTEKDYDKIFCVDKFMHKVFLDGNGKQKVIGEFVCDMIDDFYCASIPYRKKTIWVMGSLLTMAFIKLKVGTKELFLKEADLVSTQC